MKLYYYPGACSLAAHIALREAGIDFDFEQVDLATHRTASGDDFTAVNPLGYVPALVLDDGEVLTEGPAILQHVGDLAPDTGLALPVGTRERLRLQEWLNFVTAELHKPLGLLFKPDLPQGFREVIEKLVQPRLDHLERHLAGGRFLLGDAFSVADAYAFSILNWTGPLSIDLALWKNVHAYFERIASRPAVAEAMRAEGLIERAA